MAPKTPTASPATGAQAVAGSRVAKKTTKNQRLRTFNNAQTKVQDLFKTMSQELKDTEDELRTTKAELDTIKTDLETQKIDSDDWFSSWTREVGISEQLRVDVLRLEANNSIDAARIAELEQALSEAKATAQKNKDAQEKLDMLQSQWSSMSTILIGDSPNSITKRPPFPAPANSATRAATGHYTSTPTTANFNANASYQASPRGPIRKAPTSGLARDQLGGFFRFARAPNSERK